MGYKYNRMKRWNRIGAGFIIVVILNLLLLALNMYMHGSLGMPLIITKIILAGIGSLVGTYYFHIPNKDYIRINGYSISIHRGPILPRKVIAFREIKKFIEISNVVELHLINGKVQQFNSNWLVTNDLVEIKERLSTEVCSGRENATS